LDKQCRIFGGQVIKIGGLSAAADSKTCLSEVKNKNNFRSKN
jgi:hypothetical protein